MPFFLFPGQGSQKPGMLHDFYESSENARSVIDSAVSTMGDSFLSILFEGPEDSLRDTRVAQPALVTAGIAISAHLHSIGIEATGTAGHSIGEIAALAVAGSLETETAIAMAKERARLMAEESPEGTMAAVLGLAPEAIQEALPEGTEIANFNGPQQTIISGTKEAVETAQSVLKEAGAKRVLPLNVSGPFHSTNMQKAAELFEKIIADITITTPSIPFFSSVSGRQESDPEQIRELLWKQLYSPVLWTQTMNAIGPIDAFEVGPGNVLAGIARRIDTAPTVTVAGTLEAIEKIQAH
jgi:[acyl-carrier-protein] S-malonyltransferase